VDKRVVVVLLTFVVAITPSVSDAEQLRRQWASDGGEGIHPWIWIGAWYGVLLFVLLGLWERL
jgi:hypothetical protein